MTFIAQYLVLCSKNSLDRTHQCSSFTGKISVNFFFEIGFKQITAANGDTECNHAFYALPVASWKMA